MALIPFTNKMFSGIKLCMRNCAKPTISVRNLVSKQLVYSEFGEPLHVVKYRECEVPELGRQDVLVRMLAAPVNPADINTIQGISKILPGLPTIPGDEGVGEVVEVGDLVNRIKLGQRVVLSTRHLGSWRYYGVYNERDLHVVSQNIPLAEASMLAISPCLAYRMICDFKRLCPGDTVIQNAANSPCGQSIIQLCRAYDLKTFNIVANHCGFENVKEQLISLGADAVHTLEEAEELSSFDTSLQRPKLALNCLGGRYEDVMLKLLDTKGAIVYYGCAYDLPLVKRFLRPDISFHKFYLNEWDADATPLEKDVMLNEIMHLIVTGKFKAPSYYPVELQNYIHAFRNTASCEAFSTQNYVFDFTLPW